MARLLVVDDSAVTRSFIRSILVALGHSIIEADGLDQAVAAYMLERPDGVLLDLIMPRHSGMEVLQELLTIDPGVRVIMLTSVRDRETVLEAAHLGIRDYVGKPFAAERLRDAVRRLLA